MKKQHLEKFISTVWNQGDTTTLEDLIHPQYTIHHDPNDPWDGMTLDRAAFQNRVELSRAPIPDQAFSIQSCYENDDSVCITWFWQGIHKGAIASFQPTGKTITMSGATIYYFQEGLISGHWQVADRLTVFQQLQSNQAA